MKKACNHHRLLTALLTLSIAWLGSGPALAESPTPSAVPTPPTEGQSVMQDAVACDATTSMVPELPSQVFVSSQSSHHQSVPIGGHKEDLADFCDTSANHGTSASCEANLTIPAGTCSGRTGSSGCSKVGCNGPPISDHGLS